MPLSVVIVSHRQSAWIIAIKGGVCRSIRHATDITAKQPANKRQSDRDQAPTRADCCGQSTDTCRGNVASANGRCEASTNSTGKNSCSDTMTRKKPESTDMSNCCSGGNSTEVTQFIIVVARERLVAEVKLRLQPPRGVKGLAGRVCP